MPVAACPGVLVTGTRICPLVATFEAFGRFRILTIAVSRYDVAISSFFLCHIVALPGHTTASRSGKCAASASGCLGCLP